MSIIVSKFNTGDLGHREMSIITEVCEVIQDKGSYPKFYKGTDWYMEMLVVSEEVSNVYVDKVIRCYTNAEELNHLMTSDLYVDEWRIDDPRILEGLSEALELEDVNYLAEVGLKDGTVYFRVVGMEEVTFNIYD